ncbi:signal transduction protein [Lentilitoribacter sp. Alg239-R112]|uniref:signal transduction protein n=1 Tax=Lentilitoribacter sp. Alg239-R112 TaxID=2305987 RepID=UPI0013A6F453|nr:signal transduction protein [Lentilitoribacter sp. Alg239-R112]
MTHPLSTLLLAACITTVGANAALADQLTDGKQLAIATFKSIDENERGYIDMGEYNAFGDNIFISMDADDNGKVDVDEFLFWDFGWQPLAEERGSKAALETAMRIVHAFWDRNGDGQLTRSEQRSSSLYDFQRADLNSDAVLTQAEFLSGFTVMKAIRAAVAQETK